MLAQTEHKLKRKHDADERAASLLLVGAHTQEGGGVQHTNKAMQHHKTQEVIGKLSAQGLKALERCEDMRTAALLSHVHLLEISVAKQEARVMVKEAKLRSLRRRLRKRRLLGLCRW